jgi:hypothetical protein
MKAQRTMLLIGSLWELVRFFLVLGLLAASLQAVAGAGSWVYPWLLLAGSGNLLIAAGAFMLALFPDRYNALISFLRLGKVLSIFTYALLVISGALRMTGLRVVFAIGPVPVTQGVVLVGVFILDMLFLGALFAWREGEEHRPLPPGGDPAAELPEYRETEVKDLH